MSELLAILAAHTGLTAHDIRRIAFNAPSRYKVFQIAKRRGGSREIAQPAREVKVLQRILADHVLRDLPVHPAAMAYRRNYSIRKNAEMHAGHGPIMKLDFKDFFPSISNYDWTKYCNSKHILADVEDRWITSRLFFYRKKGQSALKLSIGAPTSPAISNILMYEFDRIVTESLERDQVIYTRYADDLTFSARRTGFLNAVQPAVRAAIKQIDWPRLTINDEKTVVATPKYKREVTGLILANDGRVTIGRELKREIRAAVHHMVLGRLSDVQIQKLCGLLAHVNAVEPEFLLVLKKRYGDEVVAAIQRARTDR